MNDSERAGHTARRRADRQDECGDRRSAERNDLVDPDLILCWGVRAPHLCEEQHETQGAEGDDGETEKEPVLARLAD